jgi:hypothetical protein
VSGGKRLGERAGQLKVEPEAELTSRASGSTQLLSPSHNAVISKSPYGNVGRLRSFSTINPAENRKKR